MTSSPNLDARLSLLNVLNVSGLWRSNFRDLINDYHPRISLGVYCLPMAEEDSDLRRLLEDFVGPDETRAQASFTKLSPRIRAFIKSYLGSSQVQAEQQEDIAAKTMIRLWNNRLNIKIQSISQWWNYVRKTAKNVTIDMLPKEQVMDLFDDILAEETPDIDAAIQARHQSKLFYFAANHLWLGLRESSRRMLKRLLTMQLFYLDKRDWKEVSVTAGIRDRSRLDALLESQESLCLLAFHELYSSGRDIVGHIERKWPDREPAVTAILRMRYVYGFSAMRISQALGYEDSIYVDSVLEESLTKLPFRSRMMRLIKLKHPKKAILSEQGIFKRASFQYAFSPSQEYPQTLISELLCPPAEVSNCKFNPGILNMWLSGGRLEDELKKFMKKEGYLES